MLLAFRVLGAELFAVEFMRASPDEPKQLEGAPAGQFEFGFNGISDETAVVDREKPCR